ncbi:tetratricopeptide repeat protein [candidate division CSSED10-310 bacterium]|uniref:Tetratricopeptide repeat protein n=1 Tax=candidate division CSSED10-310 bacterium TaxID=2855610 RepID=A0ABV6YYA3_UNCC1
MKNLIPYFIQEQYKKQRASGQFSVCSLFVDISGFTRTTELLLEAGREEGAEELSVMMRHYFTPAVRAVYAQGGFITTFAGDAFTAIFPIKRYGTPVAKRALQAAHTIIVFFREASIYRSKFGDWAFGVKAGLARGDITWGIVGTQQQKAYYFKGAAIDDCARAEQHAAQGEIWASAAFAAAVESFVSERIQKDRFFHLKSITSNFLPKPHRVRKQTIDHDILALFTGPEMLALEQGEFREVVSVFISFDQVSRLDDFLSLILFYRTTYDASPVRFDFGDKGGNILLFFGAPVAHENDTARALKFILRVREETMNQAVIRAGIARGILYCGFNGSDLRQEYTLLGNAVNQSARFMMKADWGQIFVDRNIAQHRHFHFTKVGDFVYKGRQSAIPTFQLDHEKTGVESLFTGSMFGRENELRLVLNYVESALQHQFGGIVAIDGSPGTGKSRLVNEVRLKLGAQVTWLYLPCDEILKKSFNPFIHFFKDYFNQSEKNSMVVNRVKFEQKFRQLISRTHDQEIGRELIRTQSVLGALLNLQWEGSLFEQLDAKGRHENMLDAIKNLIKAECSLKPVVIELDDAHWVDRESIKVLEVLTRNVAAVPFIILAACRYHDDGSLFELSLADVPQKRINMAELDQTACAELIKEKLGVTHISEKISRLIFDKSQGNPFFTEQVVLDLLERKILVKDEQGYTLQVEGIEDILPNIKTVLISRLDRLSSDVKHIVQTAAVLGREFEVTILSAMLKDELRHLPEKIIQAEQEAIWHALSEIKFIFKHALMRDSAYAMQLKARLRKLHQLAAEAIETVYHLELEVHYADLAYHYEKAEKRSKTLHYLERAGVYAQQQFQNEAALQFYDRLLGRLNTRERKIEIDTLLKKGELLHLIGQWTESRDILLKALQGAETFADGRRIASVQHALGVIYRQLGDYKSAMKCHQQALNRFEALHDHANIGETVNAIGIVHMFQGEYHQALKCYQKQLQIAEKRGDKLGMCKALGNMGIVTADQGDFEAARHHFEKNLALAEELDDKRLISTTLGDMGIVKANTGDYEAAMDFFQKQLEIAQELGDKAAVSRHTGNMGELFRLKGNIEAAMSYYEKALNLCTEIDNKRGLCRHTGNIGNAYLAQGDYDAAIDCFDETLRIARAINYRWMLPHGLIEKAEALYALNVREGYSSEVVLDAKKMNDEGLKIALEVRPDYLVRGQLLAAKIKFTLATEIKDIAQETAAINALENLLEHQNPPEVALIYYELWKMSKTRTLEQSNTSETLQIGSRIEEYRQKALPLLKVLSETHPGPQYQTYLEELQRDRVKNSPFSNRTES